MKTVLGLQLSVDDIETQLLTAETAHGLFVENQTACASWGDVGLFHCFHREGDGWGMCVYYVEGEKERGNVKEKGGKGEKIGTKTWQEITGRFAQSSPAWKNLMTNYNQALDKFISYHQSGDHGHFLVAALLNPSPNTSQSSVLHYFPFCFFVSLQEGYERGSGV
jgi:hypothetical protein